MLAVPGLDRARETDAVTLREKDFFGAVERKLARLGERHRSRVGHRHSLTLLEALCVLVKLQHISRPVRRGQPPLRFAGIDCNKAGEFTILLAELPGLTELLANLARDKRGFLVRRRNHEAALPLTHRLQV